VKRRDFIRLLGGAAAWPVAVPPAAVGQQQTAKNPRIGFLYGGVSEALALRVNQFLEGVRGVERRRIELVTRVAEGNPARLPTLATDIVAQKVDVLFAVGPAAVRAAHSVAQGPPVVALDLETDPVQSGLVSSLSHPGGNLTGVFFDFPDFSTKWLELLREVLPQLSRLAVLWDPSTGPVQLNAVEKVAGSMGLRLQVIEVREAGNIEEAVRTAQKESAEALLLLSSPMFGSNPATSAKFALENRFPAIAMFPEFAQTGGLMAYGPNISELYRQAGAMVDKVLAGAMPADLPIERPVRFQLVINLKTAKTLGLDVPWFLQQRADEVIE
jgi:putative tryptophan/tyrosine transport system substrate-binding protein